jgi:hypothetical protein
VIRGDVVNYWLFQINSRVWDIDAFLAAGNELNSFVVSNFLDVIQGGDQFVLWLTGKDGGVIGRGFIAGVPVRDSDGITDEYWVREPPERTWSVPIEVTEMFRDDPLSRDVFKKDALLKQTTIVRAAQSANPFRLTSDQWSRIMHLLDSDVSESSEWNLIPGDRIKRTDLHSKFGGRTQSGITSSTSSPNVLVFTDAATGEQYGYFDEWGTDGCFYYTGEGQTGDQDPNRGGNKALLKARQNRNAIRVFDGTAETVTYLGRFELDVQAPFVWATAPSRDGGPVRKVVRFRLRPTETLGGEVARVHRVGQEYRERDAEVQVRFPAASNPVDPDAYGKGLRSHIRTEQALARLAMERGLRPLTPTIEDPPFDVAWEMPDGSIVLVEVKSTNASNETKQLRLGLGQILDYADSLQRRGYIVHKAICTTTPLHDRRWIDITSSAGVHLFDPSQSSELPGLLLP